MINAGLTSSPTDFDQRRRLVSLRASGSVTDAIAKESGDRKSGLKSCMCWLLKLNYGAQASATSHD